MSSPDPARATRRATMRPWRAAILLLAMMAAPQGHAAEAEALFRIEPKPLTAALTDFALQANVSVSTEAASRCAPLRHPLIGRYAHRTALAMILAGSGCGFRQIDATAFVIVRTPPPTPAAAPAQRPPAQAPPPAPLSVPLVVVATRRPTPIDRLAYSISVADRSALAAMGIEDAGGLSQITPAMITTNLGTGRDKILLRGLSDGPLTGRAQSMVGLYLDEVRLTFNAPDPDLLLADVDQVEVLRGPQGTLYGAGSLGGVVQIQTALPDPRALRAALSATLGATQGGAGSDAAQGMLNLPLAGGRAAARLVLYRETQGGYIKDSTLRLNNVNQVERTGGRLALKLDLAPRWTLSAGTAFQAINAKDTQYALADNPPYTRNNRLREPHDNDFNEYHLALHGDLGWGVLRTSLAYIEHDLTSRYDATDAPPVPSPPGPAAFDDETHIRSLVLETTLSSPSRASPSGGPAQWLAGAYFADTGQTQHSALTILNAAPTTSYQDTRRDRLDEGALFGEVTLYPLPLTSLTLGGRLSSSHDQVSSLIREPLAGISSPYRGAAAQSGFAPKVVISVRPTPKILVYLQGGEGFRAGGLNTTGLTQTSGGSAEQAARRRYSGDELWSVEAGLRLSLLQERLHLDLTAFEAYWKNIQSDQLLPSGLPYTVNIGDGRNTGLEFEGRFRSGGLELRGEFLFNSPELARVNPTLPALADQSLAVAPNVSLGVSAHYAWPLQDRRSFSLDGRWAYVGVSSLTLNAAPTPKMGGYATGRLAASVFSPRWRVTLALDNPANARGDTFAFGDPFSLGAARQVTPLRPRTLSLTLAISQ
ncbi:MAG: TonB-dependent receptor [Caulobacteraceae bacterium]|nr:TonB-dependent receptor [Caulobacteraceae bacterium]